MKVLQTGLTSTHTNDSLMKIFGMADGLVAAMEGAGHTVEQRRVGMDEDISGYDVIAIGLAPFNSLGVRVRFAETMRVKMEAERLGIPYFFIIDDWNDFTLFAACRTLGKEDRFRKKIYNPGYYEPEWLIEHLDWIYGQFEWFLDTSNWPLTAACFFPWGNRDKLLELYEGLTMEQIVPFDLTQIVPDHPVPEPDGPRERAWVLASLWNHSEWAEDRGLTWPVEQYGHRKSNQPRVKEREIPGLYRRYWGVMSPPYRMSETGWWRNRYAFAARAGSILLADKLETQFMGEPYDMVASAPATVEKLTDIQLAVIANEQREWLMANTWTPERVYEQADNLLRRLTHEGV